MLARALLLSILAGSLACACGKTSRNSAGAAGTGGQGGEAGADSAAGRFGADGGDAGAGDTEGGAGGSADAGAAGEAGDVGEALSAGLIVVGTTVGATLATEKHFVVLIDPTDGHELARTQTVLDVLGVAHEAARDKWFVFTGTPGPGSGPSGTLLVGTMRSAGFVVEESVTVPKPTNQNTIAMLNRRILYRTASHVGPSNVDDTLTLLDTTSTIKPIGKLNIPVKYSLVSAVGAPAAGDTAGGRVFFLHDNLDASDNCVAADVGTEEACTVYSSSLPVAAADTSLTLSIVGISPVTQIDRDGSDAALGIQPSGNTVVIVAPPRRAVSVSATAYRYDANTGAAVGAPIPFSLETATTKIDPTNSITLPAVAVDPCIDRLFTGELANTALLYAVPFEPAGSVTAFDPAAANGIFGALAYEPYTKTLINFNSDTTNPTFSGFQVGGTLQSPVFGVRGAAGQLPWKAPLGLVPSIVVVKNPVNAPCD